MELRYYQQEAIASIYEHLRTRDDNPVAVLPTGAGKTPILAAICRDAVANWNGRVLVLTHVKELIQQSAGRIQSMLPAGAVGVYSAGMKQRDTKQSVIVAGVQSVYDKGEQLGRFDLVIIDEAHLLPSDGDGMYRQLLRTLKNINPAMRVIGLTATPYRLDCGTLCSPEGFLNSICYEVGVRQLIAMGFLCKLVGKHAANSIDTSKLYLVRGEFDQQQTTEAFDAVIESAIQEIVAATANRKSVLIFAQNVAHAHHVAERLRGVKGDIQRMAEENLKPAESLFELIDENARKVAADYLEENGHDTTALRLSFDNDYQVGEIYGNTRSEVRDRLISEFRAGTLKYLVNVNVLTTGFDATNVDAVVILRSTASAGLFYQMVGRGFRPDPCKHDCLVLDFGENLLRHGPVDQIRPRPRSKSNTTAERPAKICPSCQSVMAAGARVCLDCGTEFPVNPTAQHNGKAGEVDPVSDPDKSAHTDEEYEVLGVLYSVHTKKDATPETPKTLRVDYKVGLADWQSEWVCVEHSGFAGNKAHKWWSKRCNWPMPSNVYEALQFAEMSLLADTHKITVRRKPGERFTQIVSHELGDVPESPAACPECGTLGFRCIEESQEQVRAIASSLQELHNSVAGKIVCGGCGTYVRWATEGEIRHFRFISQQPDVSRYRGLIHLGDVSNLKATVRTESSSDPSDDDIPF